MPGMAAPRRPREPPRALYTDGLPPPPQSQAPAPSPTEPVSGGPNPVDSAGPEEMCPGRKATDPALSGSRECRGGAETL